MKSAYSRIWVALTICTLLWPTVAFAGKRGQSTPEDRARVVKLTHQLEADPLGPDAPTARQWLIPWVEKVKDITVTVCDLLGPIPGDDVPYSGEILTQMMFSNAAFQIEHPDKVNDQVAVQTAGVAGALRAYEAILKVKPEARIPFLDDLLRKLNDGEFEAHMRTVVPEKCK